MNDRATSKQRATLGLVGALAIGLNTIVGSGIFRLPAELVRDLGAWSPWIFVAGALLLAPVGLSYALCAKHVPRDGAAQAYAEQAFGSRTGVVVGFATYVATVTTLAATAVAIAGQMGLAHERLWGAAIVVALGASNLFGLRTASSAATLVAGLKVTALLALSLAAALLSKGALAAGPSPDPAKLGGAILVVVYAFSGFETSVVAAGHTTDATRSGPRAVLASLATAALVYVLVQWAVARGLPDAASSTRPLADLGGVLFGSTGSSALVVLGVVSLAGLAHAMAVTAPILLRATVARSPVRALEKNAALVSTALGVLFVVGLDFRALVDFTSVLVLLQYGVTAVAAPRIVPSVKAWSWPLAAVALAGVLYVASRASGAELGLAALSMLPGLALAVRARPE